MKVGQEGEGTPSPKLRGGSFWAGEKETGYDAERGRGRRPIINGL